MKVILEAGFVFWGLFLVFGLIVVAYLVWMAWAETRTPTEAPAGSGEGDNARAGGAE